MSGPAWPRGGVHSFSDRLYRALLLLYPRAFRHEFGPLMAQAFHDSCRQAQAERGVLGMAGLWALVLGDLAVSAFQEHLSKESAMSRSTIVRAAGAAALLGGMLYLLSVLTHPTGLARAAVPGSILLMLLSIVGLHARLWGREGLLGWLGFVLVGTGLLLGLIGMAGSALGILDPNPIAPIINTGEHAGLVFIGAGLLLWGILTLQLKALGRWSVLPLLMGLLSLTGIVFLIPPAFSALESSVVPQVFALSWVLLGFALLTTRPGAATISPQPVAG